MKRISNSIARRIPETSAKYPHEETFGGAMKRAELEIRRTHEPTSKFYEREMTRKRRCQSVPDLHFGRTMRRKDKIDSRSSSTLKTSPFPSTSTSDCDPQTKHQPRNRGSTYVFESC
jgi:hypothetical protein